MTFENYFCTFLSSSLALTTQTLWPSTQWVTYKWHNRPKYSHRPHNKNNEHTGIKWTPSSSPDKSHKVLHPPHSLTHPLSHLRNWKSSSTAWNILLELEWAQMVAPWDNTPPPPPLLFFPPWKGDGSPREQDRRCRDNPLWAHTSPHTPLHNDTPSSSSHSSRDSRDWVYLPPLSLPASPRPLFWPELHPHWPWTLPRGEHRSCRDTHSRDHTAHHKSHNDTPSSTWSSRRVPRRAWPCPHHPPQDSLEKPSPP